MKSMPKVILFDLGGVLWNGPSYLSYLKGRVPFTGTRLNTVITAAKSKYKKVQAGKISFSKMCRILSKRFRIDSEIFYRRSLSKGEYPNKDVIKLIGKLSKKYKVGLLTNISKERYELVVESGHVPKTLFHFVFPSFKLGLVKPNPKIYKNVMKEMKILPSQLVFIDDKRANVIAARKSGIRALHFTNYKKLRSDLKRLGVAS